MKRQTNCTHKSLRNKDSSTSASGSSLEARTDCLNAGTGQQLKGEIKRRMEMNLPGAAPQYAIYRLDCKHQDKPAGESFP